MRRIYTSAILIAFITFALVAFTKPVDTTPVKCMIQLTNYNGEGAYVIISLINPDDEYEQTLYVQGTDHEWYNEITQWWQFYGKHRPDLDAISGATVSGGERKVNLIKIPNNKIDAGYSLRFETAVEDQEYYVKDLQFELTTANLKTKKEGTGYIRYVRMMPQ